MFDEAGKGVIPKNTRHNNEWASRVFRLWMQQRNRTVPPADAVPEDVLESRDLSWFLLYQLFSLPVSTVFFAIVG